MPQRLVYVIGPYRANTEYEVRQNIRRADRAALALWRAGAAVICPHKNTAGWGGAAPDEVWLKGDIEMLRRCDAVYLLDGWELSAGSRAEVEYADSAGLPKFTSLDEMGEFLNPEPAPGAEVAAPVEGAD